MFVSTNNGGIYMNTVEFKDVVKVYGKGEGQQVAVDHVNGAWHRCI